MATLREELRDLLNKHVAAAVDEAIGAYRRHINAGLGEGNGRRRGRPPAAEGGTTGKARRRRTTAAKVVRHCPVPGCTKPTKGPRFRFFCEEHRELPRAEQDRYLAEQKKGGDGAPAKGEASGAPARKARRRGRAKKK